MKLQKRLACLLLVLLLTLSLAPAAFAQVVFSGEEQGLDGEIDATAFLAGANPVNSADVKGILFEAGNTVSAGGSSEYAFVAGNVVTVSGSILRDAFVGGKSVSFTGDCARDLLAAAETLDIRGTVGRDLAAGGKIVVISGKVGGDVYLSAEQITVTDGAEIGGTLRYNSNAKISAPDEVLARAAAYEDKQAGGDEIAQVQSQPKSPSILSRVKSFLFRFAGLLLIAYLLLWLTPLWEKLDADYTGKSFGTYAKTGGIGFAVLAGLPLAAIILMITVVGLRAAFVLLMLYTAVLIAAPVCLGFFLGVLLWRKALKKARNYWAELALGLLLWSVLAVIPYVSAVLKLVSIVLGLGVFTRLLGKKKAAAPVLPESVG